VEIERRQHERQKLYSPEYFDMGAENGGMIVDISEDGLGFQAVGRVEKGAEIAVSFSLGAGYRISTHARIAWVGPNGNSGGTTFTRLPADSRSIIREWVAKTAEAEAAREAAAAVQAEITAPESGTEETPLVIERIESPRAPLRVPAAPAELAPETFVAAEPLTESVKLPAQEAIQSGIPVVETLATLPDTSPTAISAPIVPQDVPSDATAAAEPLVASVVVPVARPTARNDALRDIETSVESDSHANIQPNLQPQQDVSAHAASSADASSSDGLSRPMPLSPGTPPETRAPVAPTLSVQAPENRPKTRQVPSAPPRTELPRPLFPPRNTGELFSRSPWISGQSLREEERSHKALIAVIVVVVIVAASVASVPYIRSHRQEIGVRIESMGRSVAGEPAQNASAPSQQPSQQSAQQQPQQTSQPSPQTVAPHSSTPSPSGDAISANASLPVRKSSQASAPSASTAAPAPEIRPNAPSANSGSAAATQSPPVASPPSVIPPAAGSTQLLAAAGQTEFTQAQKYLNGAGGAAADPAEAAELFWRSLEKGNTAAAIPLADLYLQGKGVSRSCLQARILLTAASNKGNAEATQKLGQLPENCE